MRKLVLFSILVINLICNFYVYSSPLFLAKMGVEQGFMLNKPESSPQDLDATNSINAYFAYKSNFSSLISAMFVYSLDYRGPGIKGYSYQSFSSRSLDNYILGKIFYHLSDSIKFDFKADFLYEFYNIGTEKWTDGLYNFGKIGIGSGVSYDISAAYILTSAFNVSYVWFPNYTDLESEIINVIEGISGSIKQNFWQFGFDLSFEAKTFILVIIDYSFIYRVYPSFYINSENVSEKEKQYDLINIIKLNTIYQGSLTEIKLFFGITNYNSNYNYMSIVDYSTYPIQIDYNKNYLDYTSFDSSLSFIFFLSSSSSISITPGVGYKKYSNRHPRKNDGSGRLDYSKIEWDMYYGGSISYRYQSDEIFSFQPIYSLQIGRSNNKDINVNNNYVSHYFGFKIDFEY